MRRGRICGGGGYEEGEEEEPVLPMVLQRRHEQGHPHLNSGGGVGLIQWQEVVEDRSKRSKVAKSACLFRELKYGGPNYS